MNITWTAEAVRALGATTSVETAGSIFGLSRTQTYEAIKAGRFPVEVIKIGRRIIVPTIPIRALLGIGEPDPAEPMPASAARPLRAVGR